MTKKSYTNTRAEELIKGNQDNIAKLEAKVSPKQTWKNFFRDLGNKLLFAGSVITIVLGSIFTGGALAATLVLGGLMGAGASVASTFYHDREERREIAASIGGAKRTGKELAELTKYKLERKDIHGKQLEEARGVAETAFADFHDDASPTGSVVGAKISKFFQPLVNVFTRR